MRNLTGYLKKILYLSSLLFLFSFFSKPIYAQQDFNITSEFTHSLQEDVIDTEIILTLTPSIDRVLTYYTATVPIENLTVECFDLNQNQKLDCSTHPRENATDVLIDTNNTVVRTDNPFKIRLTYSTQENIENAYNITSYIEDTTVSNILISYPKSKGEPFWSSDPIQNIKASGNNYIITIQKPQTKTTSILFGKSVNYEFNISRVLNNTLTEENQTFELIIPSDTDTQTIIFEKIEPLPNIATQDKSGNYIFKYITQPGETIDASIKGYIQMHKKNTSGDINTISLIQNVGYWEISNSSEIRRVIYFLQKDKGLKIQDDFESIDELDKDFDKTLLYKYLNEYVKERLEIKKDIELGIEKNIRLGCNTLIENPNDSSQEDYADFLIAISRSFKIPSRMKVGYISGISGYTSDGFYHSWVELYDDKSKKWIILDPFLEDYWNKSLFNSDFLDHITVLTREESPTSPKLTFYNPNDFVVKAKQDINITPILNAEVSLSFEENNLINRYINGRILFSNTGNIAITSYEILKSNINAENYIDHVKNLNSQIILPKQNGEISLNIPIEKVTQNPFISISLKNQDLLNKDFLLETSIDTKPLVFITILSKILSVTIFVTIVYLIYSFLTRYIKRKK